MKRPDDSDVSLRATSDLTAGRHESTALETSVPLSEDEAYKRFKIPEFVATDLHCFGCGYNLRTLNTRNNCPECGADIWLAYTENVLRMADPAWLARLTIGLRLVLASVIPMIGAIVVGPSELFTGIAHEVLTAIALLLMIVIALTGMIYLTTPCPTATSTATIWSPSTAARVLTAASLVGALIALALSRVPLGAHYAYAIAAVASPAGLSGWVAIRSLTVHFEQLASLAGSSFGTARARLYRKWVDASWSLLVLSFMVGWLAPGIWCIGFIAGATALGIGILTFTLPANYVDELAEAARFARESRRNE